MTVHAGERPVMRALSVRQPHACLIASGEKLFEYRKWQPRVNREMYRGPLLICASKKRDVCAFTLEPTGCTICIVRVVDVKKLVTTFAWRIELVKLVPNVPVSGALGLWIPSDDTLRAIGEIT